MRAVMILIDWIMIFSRGHWGGGGGREEGLGECSGMSVTLQHMQSVEGKY